MDVLRCIFDAGHGVNNNSPGKTDPGATSGPYSEHEIVSGLAGGLAQAWVFNDEVTALKLPELSRRDLVTFANGIYEPGDLFLSLHLNSSPSSKATGTEVVIARTAPPARLEQAKVLGQEIARVLRLPWRGVVYDDETPNGKGAGLLVLRGTKAPAFLIEFGFISNQKDREAVIARGIQSLAEGIRALKDANV